MCVRPCRNVKAAICAIHRAGARALTERRATSRCSHVAASNVNGARRPARGCCSTRAPRGVERKPGGASTTVRADLHSGRAATSDTQPRVPTQQGSSACTHTPTVTGEACHRRRRAPPNARFERRVRAADVAQSSRGKHGGRRPNFKRRGGEIPSFINVKNDLRNSSRRGPTCPSRGTVAWWLCG